MNYKDIIGYSKSKKITKKKTTSKKTILDEVKQELNEWYHQPPSTKRWSKTFSGQSGLTEHEREKLKEAGFESKDGKVAQRQYKRIYDRNIKNGENYFASSVDQLADFMEKQGLGNQAQMLRGEYTMNVQKWYDKWLKQFVKSLK